MRLYRWETTSIFSQKLCKPCPYLNLIRVIELCLPPPTILLNLVYFARAESIICGGDKYKSNDII
eukprot:snap_masked-scaffold_1-processed-gene-8.35-mRNA-1 protein AED:1.00 eAED:1.00 QI:0/0/0/0/1/1/2/0/64